MLDGLATAAAEEGTTSGRHVLIGTTPEATRTCAALTSRGADVVHLDSPSDVQLSDALQGHVTSVVVLLHDDTQALRYCLAAEHLRPGIPMVAALFDKTASAALVAAVPNCRVTSPADVASPSLTAACLPGGAAAICSTPSGWSEFRPGAVQGEPYRLPRALRTRARAGVLLGQLRPHDSGSTILLAGLVGIALLLTIDTVLGVTVLHEPFVDALNAAVRTVATVGPAPVDDAPGGYLLFASVAMLLTIGLTAMFTAGIVEHLLSGRMIGLVGRRVLPQRGHVVVVGMGQVGLRLAAELRQLGVAVTGIDRDPRAPNLRTARALGIPVLIGDGSRRRILTRVRVDRAIALCAVGSDELDNVAVAVTARAVAPELTVVLRAGNHDVIEETRSLFRIGTVCDVTELTSAYVVSCVAGDRPVVVVSDGDGTCVRSEGSAIEVPTGDTSCPHSEPARRSAT
ncbi:MAG: NAD-binding protein [Candidatus Nanopelagicales bacterium]